MAGATKALGAKAGAGAAAGAAGGAGAAAGATGAGAGLADIFSTALSGKLGPGELVRKGSEMLPKGSPVQAFAQHFGNSFDPLSGKFRPDALFDKDTNKLLGDQRQHLQDLMDGDPGSRPIDTIINLFMQASGGAKDG